MLREAGFSDVAIHDIAQVAALFNYYNRIADGLGIDPEPDHPGPHRHGG
jgi:alkylhydroperoxidase family enzyme